MPLLWTRFDSYVTNRLVGVFAYTLTLFSLVLFFSDSLLDFLKEVHKFALPVESILKEVFLHFPFALSLALPVSCFVAVLLTYNQLNQQFELIAFRVHGISLRRLVGPACLLGLLCTGLSFWLVESVIPWAHQKTNALRLEALKQRLIPQNQLDFSLADYDKRQQLRKLLFVGKTQGKTLTQVTYLDLAQTQQLQLVQSSVGEIYPDHWVFRDAHVYELFQKGQRLGYSHVGVLKKANVLEATDKLEDLQKKLQNTKGKTFQQLLGELKQKLDRHRSVEGKLWVKLWEKVTLPLSCLALALVAVPLAMAAPRIGPDRGFLFAVAFLFGFYILRSVLIALGQLSVFEEASQQVLFSFVVTLLPVLLLTGSGLWMLARKNTSL